MLSSPPKEHAWASPFVMFPLMSTNSLALSALAAGHMPKRPSPAISGRSERDLSLADAVQCRATVRVAKRPRSPSETVCPRAQCRPLADGRGQVSSLGGHPRSAQTEKARYALPLCQLVSDPRVGGLAGPSAGWSGAEASLTAAQNSSSDCVVDPSPLLLASQRPRAGRERESLPRCLGWRATREVSSGSC